MANCIQCGKDVEDGGIRRADGIRCSDCDCLRNASHPQGPSPQWPWRQHVPVAVTAIAFAVILTAVLVVSRGAEQWLKEEGARKEAEALERERQLEERLEALQRQSLEREETLKKEIQKRELAQKLREQELLAQFQDKLEKQQAEHAQKLADELREKERAAEMQRQLADLEAKKRELELTSRLQLAEAKSAEQQRQLQEQLDSAKKALDRNEQERRRQDAQRKKLEEELALERTIVPPAASRPPAAPAEETQSTPDGVYQREIANQYFRTLIVYEKREYVYECRARFAENTRIVKTLIDGTECLKITGRDGKNYLFPTALSGGHGGFRELAGVGWIFTGRP